MVLVPARDMLRIISIVPIVLSPLCHVLTGMGWIDESKLRSESRAGAFGVISGLQKESVHWEELLFQMGWTGYEAL